MTIRGFVVTFIGTFITVLALGTEIKEFYVMSLCFCGLILYSLLSLLSASLTLNVRSQINKGAALRDEEISYKFYLTGIALLPVAGYLSVKTADVTPKKKKRLKHSFVMMPSFLIKREFAFELPCKHIGLWQVGIKKLRFEDLFGLFCLPLIRSSRENFTAELAVMPKLHYIEEPEESTTSGGFGNSSFSNAEEGELLGDSRLYREGDSLKRINWKQSARAKKLYARQYEMLQKPKIVIAVDTGFVSENMHASVDVSFETALALANYFVEELNYVEIVALRLKEQESKSVFEIKTTNEIVKMQYDFSNIRYSKTTEALTLAGMDDTYFSKADKLYFITDNLSEVFVNEIKEMNKNGKYVRCIVTGGAPCEEVLASMGDTNLVTFLSSALEIAKKAGAVL